MLKAGSRFQYILNIITVVGSADADPKISSLTYRYCTALHKKPFHHRATERLLPYGITQCYLPPDTGERAPT